MEGDSRNTEELGACGGVPEVSCAGDADNETAVTLFTEQESYLNKIHTQFLDNVKPVESGILDILRETEVLSSEDEQSIAGGNTRREKARRLLKVLHRIPEEDFVDNFLPKFKEEYPHVVAGTEFKPGPSSIRCLRHAMMKRLNLKRLVDILPALNCCSQEEYKQLQAVEYYGEKEWIPVFQLLQKNISNPQLCQKVETLLLRKKINQQECFPTVAAAGFVCTCIASRPVSASLVPQGLERCLAQVAGLELHDDGSSAPYPSSPPSSRKSIGSYNHDRADSGIMSISVDEAMLQPALYDDYFQTVEQKENYEKVINHINSTITKATITRTELRRLEMIRDHARSHAKPAKDEAVSEESGRKFQELSSDAETHFSRLEELYQEVLQVWESVENQDYSDSELPAGWQQLLMIRYHLLRNEVAECKHVAETAKKVLEDVRKICQQNLQ